MKCDDLMEEYLHVERYERLPFHMFFHILNCKKCRSNIRNMTLATHFSSSKLMRKASKNNSLYIRTMQQIMESKNVQVVNKPTFTLLSLSLWGVIGSVMLVIFLIIPSTQVFGNYFILQFLFTVVSFLTVCTIIFIARNLSFFVKTFNLSG